MTCIIVESAIVLVGLAFTTILFHRFPTLPAADKDTVADYPSVSVIIPARNEEVNLPLLLSDLLAQTLPVHEGLQLKKQAYHLNFISAIMIFRLECTPTGCAVCYKVG